MAKLIIEGTPEEIAETFTRTAISVAEGIEIEEDDSDWDSDSCEDECCGGCECSHGDYKPLCISEPKRGELHFSGLSDIQSDFILRAYKTIVNPMQL